MILSNLMILAACHTIVDLHLNLNIAQTEVFYFLCSVQAPLGTGEALWLFAMMLNLEGRWAACICTDTMASRLISAQRNNLFLLFCLHGARARIFPLHGTHELANTPWLKRQVLTELKSINSSLRMHGAVLAVKPAISAPLRPPKGWDDVRAACECSPSDDESK